jgi:hypothetical protein
MVIAVIHLVNAVRRIVDLLVRFLMGAVAVYKRNRLRSAVATEVLQLIECRARHWAVGCESQWLLSTSRSEASQTAQRHARVRRPFDLTFIGTERAEVYSPAMLIIL